MLVMFSFFDLQNLAEGEQTVSKSIKKINFSEDKSSANSLLKSCIEANFSLNKRLDNTWENNASFIESFSEKNFPETHKPQAPDYSFLNDAAEVSSATNAIKESNPTEYDSTSP